MEQQQFLENKIFSDLKNINTGFDDESVWYFSEADFEKLLERCEYFGISIYLIKARLDGKPFEVAKHESFKKKATNPLWYNKAFKTFRMRQEGLAFAATYKVSKKLLARDL